MEIRRALKQDLTLIAEVYIAGHSVAYQTEDDKPYIERMTVAAEEAAFEPEIEYARGYFIVGVAEGQVLGFAYGGLSDQPGTAGFSELWVDPKHHGSVVSKKLTRNLVEEMIARGALRMIGYVASHNARATAFMKKAGARDVERRDMRIFNNVAELPERRVPFVGWQWDDLPALVNRLDQLMEQAET